MYIRLSRMSKTCLLQKGPIFCCYPRGSRMNVLIMSLGSRLPTSALVCTTLILFFTWGLSTVSIAISPLRIGYCQNIVQLEGLSLPKGICQLLVDWCPLLCFSDIDPQWLEKWKSKKLMKAMLLSSLDFTISSNRIPFNPWLDKKKNMPAQQNFMIFALVIHWLSISRYSKTIIHCRFMYQHELDLHLVMLFILDLELNPELHFPEENKFIGKCSNR